HGGEGDADDSRVLVAGRPDLLLWQPRCTQSRPARVGRARRLAGGGRHLAGVCRRCLPTSLVAWAARLRVEGTSLGASENGAGVTNQGTQSRDAGPWRRRPGVTALRSLIVGTVLAAA